MFRRILVASLVLCGPLAVASKPFGAVQKAAPAPPAPTTVAVVEPKVVPMKKTSIVPSKEFSQKAAVAAGMLLAFNSGFSNGVCLGGAVTGGKGSNAVAAVTGAWTNSALGLASGNMGQFAANAKGILSYLTGSLIAGLMIPKPKPFFVNDGTGATFMIGAGLMYAASQAAGNSPTAKTCFYLALMANGLQNSVSSVHTANLCRSAHFSGITSDMGTFLGQIIRGNKANVFKLKAFALLGLAFFMGGFSSFFVTQHFSSESLLVCALMHAAIGSALMAQQPAETEQGFVLNYHI